MAKNTNANTETKATETKAENASRETSVTGTTNNVGQEISPVKPSDVIDCTMTEEEHKARIKRIQAKMEAGLKLSWDIIVDIASAKERKEQELDGYTSSESDFNKWANELFGMGETQIKQAVRLVGFYGSIDDKGEYTLADKYKRFTKEKLDIIQRLPQMKTKADFDTVTEALGIMPNTSEGVLKEMVKQAKGITDKSKDNDKATDKTKESKKTREEVMESETYKTLQTERDRLATESTDVKTFIAKWFGYANDTKMSDKDFRTEFINAVKALDKEQAEKAKDNK